MSQTLRKVPGHNVVFEAGQYWYQNKKTGVMSGVEEMKALVAIPRSHENPPISFDNAIVCGMAVSSIF